MAGKGSPPAEVVLPFRFRPRRWYHVVAAHAAGGTLSAPLALLFVDGVVVSVAEKLKYPKVSRPCSLTWIFLLNIPPQVQLCGYPRYLLAGRGWRFQLLRTDL